MNIKIKSILSVFALSAAAFAAESVAPTAVRAADAAAPVASAPAEVSAATEAAPASDAAPATEASAEVAPAAPASEAPVASASAEQAALDASLEAPVAPTAVRAADASAPVASVQTESNATAAPSTTAPAPSSRRYVDVDTLPHVTQYRVSAAPVKTVYVAEKSGQDTVSLDELRGLVPLKFQLGAQGYVGKYALTDYDYYNEGFADFSFRLGLNSILPLNAYTIALKLGVIYEQSEASGSMRYEDRSSRTTTVYNLKFKERKIDVPLLFSFKAPYSRLMFDMGVQLSTALYDKFSVSSTKDGKKVDTRTDMLDEGFRKHLDWDFVFGFEYFANNFLSLNIRIDYGITSLYDAYDDNVFRLDDLTSTAFLIGCSFYFL